MGALEGGYLGEQFSDFFFIFEQTGQRLGVNKVLLKIRTGGDKIFSVGKPGASDNERVIEGSSGHRIRKRISPKTKTQASCGRS